jgi:hypothetical protein
MLSREEASAQMRRYGWILMTVGVIGCGKHSGGDATVAKAPRSAGDVWETDKAADRQSAPATVLAFVNGLHTMVVDGSDVYAGTTRLSTATDSSGTRIIVLGNGLTAQLAPAGEEMELRFSSGERVPLRKQVRKGK